MNVPPLNPFIPQPNQFPLLTFQDTGLQLIDGINANDPTAVNTELFNMFDVLNVNVRTGPATQFHSIPLITANLGFAPAQIAAGISAHARHLATFICWYINWRIPLQFQQQAGIQGLDFGWTAARAGNSNVVNVINNRAPNLTGFAERIIVGLSSNPQIVFGPGPANDFYINYRDNVNTQMGLRELFWHIVYHLEAVIESEIPGIDDNDLIQTVNLQIIRTPVGGCTSKKSFRNLCVADGLGNQVVTTTLKSSNNNCLLACIREARRRHGMEVKTTVSITGIVPHYVEDLYNCLNTSARTEYAYLRSLSGLHPNEAIDPLDGKTVTLCELAKVHLKVWSGRPEQSTLIVDINPSCSVLCQVMLKDNHYYFVGSHTGSPDYCSVCGQHHKQKCDASTVSFFKKFKKKYESEEFKSVDLAKPKNPFFKLQENWHKDKGYDFSDEGCLNNPFRASVDQCVFYDMETLVDAESQSNTHYCYAVGFKVGSGPCEQIWSLDHGNVLDVFMEKITSLPPYIVNDSRVTRFLVGYNQCKFDLKILFNYIKKSKWDKDYGTSNMVLANGRLLKLNIVSRAEERVIFTTFDPVLFMSKPLREVCEDYGVNSKEEKTMFPHKIPYQGDRVFVNKYSLVELNDPNNYLGKDKNEIQKRPYTQKELMSIPGCGDGSGRFNLRALGEDYLRRDVDSLATITKMVINEAYMSFQGANLLYFMTIAQFSYGEWLRTCPFPLGAIHCEQGTMFDFIRESIYGGRVYPSVGDFQSSQFSLSEFIDKYDVFGDDSTKIQLEFDKEVKNCLKMKGETLSDTVVELDVTSLYPAQQENNQFPLGKARWMEKEELVVFEARLKQYREKPFTLPSGIYEVSFTPNAFLNQPILPTRSKEGGLSWTLEAGLGVYTYIDVQRALEHHYSITKLHSGIIWERDQQEFLFQDFVSSAKKVKIAGDGDPVNGIPKNPSKRAMGKLVLCSSYGKTTQKKILSKSVFCCTESDVYDFIRENDWTGSIYFSHDEVLLQGTARDVENKFPSHLGSLILSHSRANMDRLYNLMDTTVSRTPEELMKLDSLESELRKNLKNTYFYTDTDSFYVKKKWWPLFKEEQESRGKTEKDFGELKNEASEKGEIIFGWWLQPKTYGYVCITENNKLVVRGACKGISLRHLNIGDFIRGFIDGRNRVVKFSTIKTFGLESYDKFMGVTNKEMERTFNSTIFGGRIPLNIDTLKYDPGSSYSVPRGHYFDEEHQCKEIIQEDKKNFAKRRKIELK